MSEEQADISNVGESPAVSGVSEAAQAVDEKMIPQSQVNDLIGKKKLEAYQRGKQDALLEFSQQKPQAAGEQPNLVGANNLSPDQVSQLVEKKIQEQSYMAAHQNAMRQFIDKMSEGSKKYPDFEEKVAQLDLPNILPVVYLANGVDNSADVMYDLANNPEKVSRLLTTVEKHPHIAQMDIKKLSSSIKANENALKQPKSAEPLDQLKPSTASMDNGSKSVDDYLNADWLRG